MVLHSTEKLPHIATPNTAATRAVVHKLVAAVFATLDKGGYCLVSPFLPSSSSQFIDEGCVENHFHLLVIESQREQLVQALSVTMKNTGWRLLIRAKDYQYQTLRYCDPLGTIFFIITVRSSFHYRGLPFANFTKMVGRVGHEAGNIPVLQSTDLFFVELLETLLAKKRGITAPLKSQLSQFTAKQFILVSRLIKGALGERVGRQMIHALRHQKWTHLESLIPTFRLRLLRRRLVLKPKASIRALAQSTGCALRNLKHSKEGYFVAVIGPDGAGKSTVLDRLEEQLRQLFPLAHSEYRRFYNIPEPHELMVKLRHALLGENHSNVVSNLTVEGLKQPLILSLMCCLFIYESLDYLSGYPKIKRATAHGDLVAFDRYFYDLFVMRRYKKLPGFCLPLLIAIAPTPDLVIFLRASPNMILSRKEELSKDEIIRQNDAFEEIIAQLPYGKIIDNDQPLAEVIGQIKEIILSDMAGGTQ